MSRAHAHFALLALALFLEGCAAFPGLASALGMAAPVVTAIDTQLQRAQQLAPGLSPTRPDDAALLEEIMRRLNNLDACDAAKITALTSAASAPADVVKTTQALIDAAAALRGLVDAINAARLAPSSTATPSPTTAGGAS